MKSEKNGLTFVISVVSLINSSAALLLYSVFFLARRIIMDTVKFSVLKLWAYIYSLIEDAAYVLYYIERLLIPLGISATVICITVLLQQSEKGGYAPLKDNRFAVLTLPVQLAANLSIIFFYEFMW